MRIKLSDLAPGVNYAIQVRANNGEAVSQWSRVFNLATESDTVPPKTPTNVAGTMAGTAFNLTWDAVIESADNSPAHDLNHYDIKVESAGTGTFRVYSVTDTKFLFSLEMNREAFGSPRANIKMSVRAVDKVGNASPYSTPVIDQTNAAPATPTGFTGTATVDNIGLKWNAVTDSDLTGYRVYSGTTAGSQTSLEWSGSATSVTLSSTLYNTDKWFKVVSVDVFGTESAASSVVGPLRPGSPFTVDTTAPAIPTGLAATLTNSSDGKTAKAAVTWNAVTDTDGDLSEYIVDYKPSSETAWNTAKVDYEKTALTLVGLLPYTNYDFRIRASDFSANLSGWSTTVTKTATANTAPATVGGVTVTAGVDSITVKWTASTESDVANGAGVYMVDVAKDSGFTNGLLSYRTGEASISINGLASNQIYYARVKAVDSLGLASAAWSSSNFATTGNFPSTKNVYIGDGPPGAEYRNVDSLWIDTTLGANTPKRWVSGTTWAVVTDKVATDAAAAVSTLNNTTIPALQAKVNASVKSYVNEYALAASETVAPTTGWSTTPPTRTPGNFIWLRTVITYSDDSTTTTPAVVLTGNTGATGSAGAPAPVVSLTATTQVLTQPAAGGATTPATAVVTGTAQNTTISVWEYSTNGGAFSATVPAGVSRTGNVVTITGASMTARTITVRMADANGVADTLTVAEVIDGAAGAAGGTGPAGADAYTVLLTNEAQVFPGSTTSANAGSAVTSVVAYKGSTLAAATIGTITGQVTGLTTAITNNGTTNATVTITVTTALTTMSGTLTIPVTVDGKTFNKIFSWTATRTGATGGTGQTGVGVSSITPYFAAVATGAAAPATPTTATPVAPWVATEPAYAPNTELYRTEKVLYTNATYTYTTVTKIQSYAAAALAQQTADGKNKIVYSTVDATGTAGFKAGDTWRKVDTLGAGGKIIAEWTFDTDWRTKTYSGLVLTELDAGSITYGFMKGNRIEAGTLVIGQISSLQDTLDDKTSKDYIASRSTDLVTNGSATLGTNLNFSGWTLDKTDAPIGAAGSFNGTSGVSQTKVADELLPVDTNKKFKLSFQAKQKGTTTTGGYLYSGVVALDAYKLEIPPYFVMYHPGTLTTLAAPLNPGDTTITINTPSVPWWGSAGKNAGASTHFRSIIWWDYVDQGGKAWPEETYSRYWSGSNYWADGGITGNVITLAAPYSGPARPAGTKLSNGTSGGSYMYGGAVNSVVPKAWTTYSATITGVSTGGGGASFATGWPIGTSYARLIWLTNRTAAGASDSLSNHSIASVSFSDASAAQGDADAVIGLTNDWKFTGTTEINGGAIRTDSIDVIKLKAGSTFTQDLQVASTFTLGTATLDGLIKSYGYTDAGTSGFKLTKAGMVLKGNGNVVDGGTIPTSTLDVNSLKASTLTSTVVNIGAGGVLNIDSTGFIKSNNFVNNSTGYSLSSSGLQINDGVVDAKALKTGSAIIGDLTIGRSADALGTLKSFDYAAGTAGWKIGKNLFEINKGLIKAEALQLQSSPNLVPPAYADFEYTRDWYISSFWRATGQGGMATSGGAADAIVPASSVNKFKGKQTLSVDSLGGTSTLTTYFGTSSTDYNVPVEPGKTYIWSGYMKNRQASSQAWVVNIKGDNGAIIGTQTFTLGANEAAMVRRSFAFTVPAGVNAVLPYLVNNIVAACAIYFDCQQIEEKTGADNTPSVWSPPGATTLDGAGITTGVIKSSQTIGVNFYPQPAWSINLDGNAQFGDVSVRGKLIVGAEGPTDYDAGFSRIQSGNYVEGVTGWRMNSAGDLDANSGTFRGTLVGNTIYGAEMYGSLISTNQDITKGRVSLDYYTGFSVYKGQSTNMIENPKMEGSTATTSQPGYSIVSGAMAIVNNPNSASDGRGAKILRVNPTTPTSNVARVRYTTANLKLLPSTKYVLQVGVDFYKPSANVNYPEDPYGVAYRYDHVRVIEGTTGRALVQQMNSGSGTDGEYYRFFRANAPAFAEVYSQYGEDRILFSFTTPADWNNQAVTIELPGNAYIRGIGGAYTVDSAARFGYTQLILEERPDGQGSYYFDGDSYGATWAGTAENSRSTMQSMPTTNIPTNDSGFNLKDVVGISFRNASEVNAPSIYNSNGYGLSVQAADGVTLRSSEGNTKLESNKSSVTAFGASKIGNAEVNLIAESVRTNNLTRITPSGFSTSTTGTQAITLAADSGLRSDGTTVAPNLELRVVDASTSNALTIDPTSGIKTTPRWIDLTMTTGWAAYSASFNRPRAMRTTDGTWVLSGLVARTGAAISVPTTAIPVATIPGFTMGVTELSGVIANSLGSANMCAQISSSGVVNIRTISGTALTVPTNGFISLGGITLHEKAGY